MRYTLRKLSFLLLCNVIIAEDSPDLTYKILFNSNHQLITLATVNSNTASGLKTYLEGGLCLPLKETAEQSNSNQFIFETPQIPNDTNIADGEDYLVTDTRVIRKANGNIDDTQSGTTDSWGEDATNPSKVTVTVERGGSVTTITEANSSEEALSYTAQQFHTDNDLETASRQNTTTFVNLGDRNTDTEQQGFFMIGTGVAFDADILDIGISAHALVNTQDGINTQLQLGACTGLYTELIRFEFGGSYNLTTEEVDCHIGFGSI